MESVETKTLSELRQELAAEVGFSGQILSGVNKQRFDNWIRRAQRHLVSKYPDAFEDVEVFVRLNQYQSSIDYHSAIDFRRSFEIAINYTGTGQWQPLTQGISSAHDSVFDQIPPRWKPETAYTQVGMRVVPATLGSFYYEIDSLYTPVANIPAVFFEELSATQWASGWNQSTSSGVLSGSGLPIQTPEGEFSGIWKNATAVRVYGRKNEFDAGDEFPWEAISYGYDEDSTYERFNHRQSDFGVAVDDGNSQFVYWEATASAGTQPAETDAQTTAIDANLVILSNQSSKVSVTSGNTEPTFPVVDGNTVEDGDVENGIIVWKAYSFTINNGSLGWPRNYELLNDSIRLWPFAESDYELKITGKRAVSRLDDDNDEVMLDCDFVLTQAIVWAKAHYRHPDVDVWREVLREKVRFIRQAAHANNRYIPAGRRRSARPLEHIRPKLISS